MSVEEQKSKNTNRLRKKAEEQLKSTQERVAKSDIEADTKKLLHELQVHQIELEMQNEELRQANETTEAALKKYTMLYDLAPMGYITLDEKGIICDLNFTAAELLDSRRYSLIDKNFNLYISKESQKVFSDFFRKVFTSTAKESCNIKLCHDNKPLSHVYIEGIVTGDDRKCLLSLVNISEIKQYFNM